MTKNVYSVSQVNNYIKNMFAEDFLLNRICIKGEVSNLKYHSSGHIYFTLKDFGGTISAVMFAGYAAKGLKFRMKDGDKVLVSGSVEIYERSGQYQIYAREIELEGAGNLYLQFEALKKELEEMGMFAPEYKRPIPKYVRTVGIVTAPTGAAIQDIRNVAGRRNPYVQLVLYPALVQGDGAKESIVAGIRALEAYGVDVMIVGRGGGSIEDLWAFNEEEVARAIFDCSVPIISAVGHEVDWTIADFVSDMRAPTPSAAAELAVFDYSQTKMVLSEKKLRLDRAIKRDFSMARQFIGLQMSKLKLYSPMNRMHESRKRLVDLEEKLEADMKQLLREKRYKLSLLAGSLEGLSPAKKISSGYAYVEGADKKALKSVREVKVQDSIELYMTDGSLKAVVTEVIKHE